MMRGRLWRMAGLLAGLTGLIVAGLAVAGGVSAVGGPHSANFGPTTDSCAGCHRAHTATAPKLLASASQYDLCTSCHDGSGANTNVVDGYYQGSSDGVQNAGLRGGGFAQGRMNTSVLVVGTGGGEFNETTASLASVTSKHNVGAAGTMWGSGAIGSGSGTASVALECGSCHNPHGNLNYRILKGTPTDSGAGSAVNLADESTKTYTITYDADHYRDTSAYDSVTAAAIGNWCGQCHTRYLAGAGAGHTDSGDSVFAYRHQSDSLATGECLNCHVAHGTTATMGSVSGAAALPDGSAGSGASDSRLLHVDSRGVCIQCHSTLDGN